MGKQTNNRNWNNLGSGQTSKYQTHTHSRKKIWQKSIDEPEIVIFLLNIQEWFFPGDTRHLKYFKIYFKSIDEV